MLHKKIVLSVLFVILVLSIVGCAAKESPAPTKPADSPAPVATIEEVAEEPQPTEAAVPEQKNESTALEDGIYSVDFNTDSGMFHVNEACDGKGTLTVENGKMTVHVTLVSKSIVNLFVGTAEDAKAENAVLLEPTEDPVTYKDGYSETVFGFDIPVEKLNSDFSLAIIGKKGTWYDHIVSVTNPEPIQ